MAQINIRVDDVLKEKAEALFEELGLNMSTAVDMFLRQAVRQGGIPFEITTKVDPFYNVENMRVLRKSTQDASKGKFTSRELIEE